MGNIVLGRPVVDTGPCSDPTYNFQRIAKTLDAMGNPSFDPGPGPELPDGTNADYDVVNPIYYDDGDIIRVDESGNHVVVVSSSGEMTSTATFYLKVSGTTEDSVDSGTASFTLTGLTVLESITTSIPYDEDLEGAVKQVPDLTSDSITVVNYPGLLITSDETVITARYHGENWFPDSIDNLDEDMRSRPFWDAGERQVLGHSTDSSVLIWQDPGYGAVGKVTTPISPAAVSGSDQLRLGHGEFKIATLDAAEGAYRATLEGDSVTIYTMALTGTVADTWIQAKQVLLGGTPVWMLDVEECDG